MKINLLKLYLFSGEFLQAKRSQPISDSLNPQFI